MRLHRFTALILIVLLIPAAAHAVTERELGIAAQGGYQILTGKAAEYMDGGGCFGINISYGLTRWFGFTGDAVYGIHAQSDSDETGEIDFTLLTMLFGPRFTLELGPVYPYADLLVGGAIWRYEVKYEMVDGEEFKDDDQRSRAALGATAGFDVSLSDNFQLGLAGRYIYLIDGFDLPNADEDLQDEPLSTIQLLLRASLVF